MRKNKLSKADNTAYDSLLLKYHKTNPEMADLYLRYSIEEYNKYGDERILFVALNRYAKVKGISNIAKKAGVTKRAAHKALSKDGNVIFSTIAAIIRSLGYKIVFTYIGM